MDPEVKASVMASLDRLAESYPEALTVDKEENVQAFIEYFNKIKDQLSTEYCAYMLMFIDLARTYSKPFCHYKVDQIISLVWSVLQNKDDVFVVDLLKKAFEAMEKPGVEFFLHLIEALNDSVSEVKIVYDFYQYLEEKTLKFFEDKLQSMGSYSRRSAILIAWIKEDYAIPLTEDQKTLLADFRENVINEEELEKFLRDAMSQDLMIFPEDDDYFEDNFQTFMENSLEDLNTPALFSESHSEALEWLVNGHYKEICPDKIKEKLDKQRDELLELLDKPIVKGQLVAIKSMLEEIRLVQNTIQTLIKCNHYRIYADILRQQDNKSILKEVDDLIAIFCDAYVGGRSEEMSATLEKLKLLTADAGYLELEKQAKFYTEHLETMQHFFQHHEKQKLVELAQVENLAVTDAELENFSARRLLEWIKWSNGSLLEMEEINSSLFKVQSFDFFRWVITGLLLKTPDKWSRDFYESYTKLCAYIEAGFPNKEILGENSFAILQNMKLMLQLYKKTHAEEFPIEEPEVISMKEIHDYLTNFYHKEMNLAFLEEYMDEFVSYIGNSVDEFEQLYLALNFIPANRQLTLLRLIKDRVANITDGENELIFLVTVLVFFLSKEDVQNAINLFAPGQPKLYYLLFDNHGLLEEYFQGLSADVLPAEIKKFTKLLLWMYEEGGGHSDIDDETEIYMLIDYIQDWVPEMWRFEVIQCMAEDNPEFFHDAWVLVAVLKIISEKQRSVALDWLIENVQLNYEQQEILLNEFPDLQSIFEKQDTAYSVLSL